MAAAAGVTSVVCAAPRIPAGRSSGSPALSRRWAAEDFGDTRPVSVDRGPTERSTADPGGLDLEADTGTPAGDSGGTVVRMVEPDVTVGAPGAGSTRPTERAGEAPVTYRPAIVGCRAVSRAAGGPC